MFVIQPRDAFWFSFLSPLRFPRECAWVNGGGRSRRRPSAPHPPSLSNEQTKPRRKQTNQTHPTPYVVAPQERDRTSRTNVFPLPKKKTKQKKAPRKYPTSSSFSPPALPLLSLTSLFVFLPRPPPAHLQVRGHRGPRVLARQERGHHVRRGDGDDPRDRLHQGRQDPRRDGSADLSVRHHGDGLAVQGGALKAMKATKASLYKLRIQFIHSLKAPSFILNP